MLYSFNRFTMKSTLKSFGDFLLVKKGLGNRTISGYKASVQAALKRLKTSEPTIEQAENHILWMHDQKYSFSHITNTSLALEWYFSFRGLSLRLGRMKKPRTIVKDTMSEAEITMLIASTHNTRERAIAAILAYSGIRNSELCNLRVCDVDLGNNMLRILSGKGKIDRMINIAGDCSRLLIEYLNDFPRNPDEFFFTTLHRDNQYSGWDLRKLVKVLARRAGISRRIYPHLFRHSLATNLLKRGANLVLIQRQLGHTFIASTEIYIRSFPQRIQNEYRMFCPSYI